jgi:hypothetical protein
MNPLKLLNKQKSIQKHDFYFHKSPNRCAIFLDGLCKKGAANELQPPFMAPHLPSENSPFGQGLIMFRQSPHRASHEQPSG